MRSTVNKVFNSCIICEKVTGCRFLTQSALALPDFQVNDLNAFQSMAIDLMSKMENALKKSMFVYLYIAQHEQFIWKSQLIRLDF